MVVVAGGVTIFVGLRMVYPVPVGGNPVPVQTEVTSIHSISAPVDGTTEMMRVEDTTAVVVDAGLSVGTVGTVRSVVSARVDVSPYVCVIQVVTVDVVASQLKPGEPELDVLEIGVLELSGREFDVLEINIALE